MVAQKRQSFRKLYFPGLISLAFLPVIFVWYLLNSESPVKYQSIHVAWLNTDELSYLVKNHLGWSDILSFRKYKTIYITGNVKKDSLEFYKLEILSKELANKKDTVNGLNISFGLNSTYGELIDVLNKRESPGNTKLIFQFINNRVLVFYVTPTPAVKSAEQSAYDI